MLSLGPTMNVAAILKTLTRGKPISPAELRRRRQADAEELRWEDASGVFVIAAAFAVATLTVLTLVG